MAPVSGSLNVIALDVMISLGLMTGAQLEHTGDVLPRPSLPESDTSMLVEPSLLMESVASAIKTPCNKFTCNEKNENVQHQIIVLCSN